MPGFAGVALEPFGPLLGARAAGVELEATHQGLAGVDHGGVPLLRDDPVTPF
jgi:hypothetical protein